MRTWDLIALYWCREKTTKQRIEKRQAPVEAFQKYRKTCDPNGLFYTQYLRDLLEG